MAEKQGIPLTSIDGFPEAVADQLSTMWITTAEELVAFNQLEDGPQNLAEFLDLPVEEVNELIDLAQTALPEDFAPPGEIEIFGLGALDEPGAEDLEPPEGAASFELLPESVNLIDRMPPIRNQRQRGTCVAFTCTAVREYLLGETSLTGDLSEQYLYWNCKERDGYPGEGTWIHIAMQALSEDGICVESVWPYNPTPVAGNEGQGPPPGEAQAAASSFRIDEQTQLSARSVDMIRSSLADDLVVAFAVPVYTYWYTQPVRSTGDVRMPLSTENSVGGHAMCIVGYENDASVPGGGYFLVRNSWGTGWAEDSTLAPGYCRIPYAYIANYGRAAHTAFAQPLPVEPVEPEEPIEPIEPVEPEEPEEPVEPVEPDKPVEPKDDEPKGCLAGLFAAIKGWFS